MVPGQYDCSIPKNVLISYGGILKCLIISFLWFI